MFYRLQFDFRSNQVIEYSCCHGDGTQTAFSHSENHPSEVSQQKNQL